MWVDPSDDPRGGEPTTDERGCLLDYLRNYRLTFEMKLDGLDAEQLARRSVPPSTLSLLGLLRHLADVEVSWFRQCLAGEDTARRYRTEADRDADFNGAVADDAVVAEAWEYWRAEVANTERVSEGLSDMDAYVEWRGEQIQVRDVLVHMVEEYARHVGHADLLRECIDGRTGQ
ncbi:DinB family protein [Nocardioides mangrovicus]|uniref:DinB family protein n=2 Tax=Nocardioides mangrovicus TaxID=2478913 RepID=A0A3L8P706_9ACTN|nr:DinB family protein [Nocardioides mangrovicus]